MLMAYLLKWRVIIAGEIGPIIVDYRTRIPPAFHSMAVVGTKFEMFCPCSGAIRTWRVTRKSKRTLTARKA